MRWNFIHHWKTCLVTRTTGTAAAGGADNGAAAKKMRILEDKIQNTSSIASTSTATPTGSAGGGGSDETDTDLITVSVSMPGESSLERARAKRWSLGSATNSEGEYSKVVVQFGPASDCDDDGDLFGGGCDCDYDWETGTLKDEPVLRPWFAAAAPSSCNGNVTEFESPPPPLLRKDTRTPPPKPPRKNGVCFVVPVPEPEIQLKKVQNSPTQASLIVAAIETDATPKKSPSPTAPLGQFDTWRALFDRFDLEGFGEIPWDYFYYIALRSPYFINEIEPGKLEVLKDLAKEKMKLLQGGGRPTPLKKWRSKGKVAPSTTTPCTAITFQYFLNIMSGKRSRSFKCAVHHRDREASSENDFSRPEAPISCSERVASCLASEFLTDDRDRKYFTGQWRASRGSRCPPPLFVPILTLLQLAFFAFYTLYHAWWPDEELLLEEEVIDLEDSTNSTAAFAFAPGIVSLAFTAPFYKPTPFASTFLHRPDRQIWQEPWRYIFFALLHASWPHLAFNAFVQLLIIWPLELVHGTGRIFLVYVIATIGAALNASVLDPAANLVGGAPGAFALLIAHCANVLLYSSASPKQRIRWARSLRILTLLVAASVDVGIAVYNRYVLILAPPPSALEIEIRRTPAFAHIHTRLRISHPRELYQEVAVLNQDLAPLSYVGHITGALLGLSLGLVVLRNFQQSLRKKLSWWVALVIIGAWILGAVLINFLRAQGDGGAIL